MSGNSYDETVKFRAGPVKEAAESLDAIHLGGINVSELAREGLAQMLRESMSDEDKQAIYERYRDDEISEAATRLLLGKEFELLEEDIAEFRRAVTDDTEQYLV